MPVETYRRIELDQALGGSFDRSRPRRSIHGGGRPCGGPEEKGGTSARVNEHPGILLYTRIRKSPYFYASRRHGVQLYSVYNHTYHPRHYGDPVEEYWQLLNGVTLWDVGGRAADRDQRAGRLRRSPTCSSRAT